MAGEGLGRRLLVDVTTTARLVWLLRLPLLLRLPGLSLSRLLPLHLILSLGRIVRGRHRSTRIFLCAALLLCALARGLGGGILGACADLALDLFGLLVLAAGTTTAAGAPTRRNSI